MKECNFSYEEKSDDLFLFEHYRKSAQSISNGNFVLDYDAEGNLVGIEVMNASTTLAECVKDEKASLLLLTSLKKCSFEMKKKEDIIILKLVLEGKTEVIHPILYLSLEKLQTTC